MGGGRTIRRSPWATPSSCMRLKRRAISINCHGEASEGRCLRDGLWGNEYQLEPPGVGVIPQILSKVEAVHGLVQETEGVSLSRVHPNKRYDVHTSVVKEGPYVDLVLEPL